MVKQFLIHITNQVKQAFLLGTLKGIVGGEEIRKQNTAKIFQCDMRDVSVTRVRIKVGHLVKSCEDPNVAQLSQDVGSRLVYMDK